MGRQERQRLSGERSVKLTNAFSRRTVECFSSISRFIHWGCAGFPTSAWGEEQDHEFFGFYRSIKVHLPSAMGLVALALLALGVNDLLPRRGRQLKAQGVVFDHIRNKGDKGDTFTPKVRFTTDDGRQVEITDGFGVSKHASAIGTAVTVMYPAENPERGRFRIWASASSPISSWSHSWRFLSCSGCCDEASAWSRRRTVRSVRCWD